MASEAKLVTQLELRIKEFERQMAKANQTAQKGMRDMEGRSKQSTQRIAANNNKLAQSFRNTASSIAVLDGPLGGVASRFSSLGTLASRAGLAMGALAIGASAAGYAAQRALAAFQKFETQQLVTQQVVRATGGAAGKTAEQIEQLAQTVAATTLASLDESRAAATQLLTFRSISGEVFDRTLKAAQDLATVGFGTLSSSAVQLGKALEDPANGLSALRRVGVSFSEQQRQVIQDLMDTGRTAEAQTKILEILEQQVGGAGKASASGLAGAYDTLSQATQTLLERWGSQIAQALNLQGAILGIARAIDAVNQRAGLSGQLAEANTRVAGRRETVEMLRSGGTTDLAGNTYGLKEAELELQRALAERQRLQMRIFREGEAQSMAGLRAIEAQKQAERERAEGVVAGLKKELELAGKTNVEKQTALKLAEAGVTAESELGQQIIRNIQAIDAAEKALKESQKKPKREKDNEFEREAKQLEDRISLLIAETEALRQTNPLLQDYGYAAEYAKAKQELLNAAQKAGLKITPELAGDIENLATQYAAASAEAGRLAEQQDNVKKSAEEMRDLGKSVLGGFIRDLREGKSGAEALANALDKVADKLLDIALDSIFSSKKSGGGGFLGGLFSGLGRLLGFSSGTANTGGARGQPRGIVHGQEAVIPLPGSGKVPVELKTPKRDADPIGGHIHVTGTFEVENGNIVPVITAVSGQVAGTMVKQANRGFIGRANSSQKRGM